MLYQINKRSNIFKLILVFAFCIKTIAAEWFKNYCGIAFTQFCAHFSNCSAPKVYCGIIAKKCRIISIF